MQNEQGDIVKCYIDGTRIWMLIDVAGEPVEICFTDVEAEVVSGMLKDLARKLRLHFGRDVEVKKPETLKEANELAKKLLASALKGK